jgi:hypothetical protein
MIDWYKDNNAELRNAFDRGVRKCRLISGDMQKKLAKCCAEEEIDVIMGELRDKKFSFLSTGLKEQMAVILRLRVSFWFHLFIFSMNA